jgi:two-component sensor histidine kinase
MMVPDLHAQQDTGRHAAGSPGSGGPRPFFPNLESIRIALEAGRIGIWSWDLRTNRVTWSSNLETIARVPQGSFDGSLGFGENLLHPDDRANVMAAVEEARRTHEPYSVLFRLAPGSPADERWLEASGSVTVENGTAVQMLGICRDVTERVRLDHELRVRARQQEAIARLGARALTEADLQTLFDELAATIAEMLETELVEILELVPGDAELLLRAGVGWKPGLVGSAHISTGPWTHAGYALAAGAPVVAEDLAQETRFSASPLLAEHGAASGIAVPIAGPDGRAYGVLATHARRKRRFEEHDVSFVTAAGNVVAGAIQRRQLDQRHELMIRELRHRSGNLFSQLLALFSQTAKTSRSVAEVATKYEARVLALANAHRLITEGGWRSTSLMELLRGLLAPYLDRIALDGPDVFLEPDPTFGLSTAVHELATNAVKHGSLSQQSGRLALSWSVGRADRGLTLIFHWREQNGPMPKRSRRTGFGSRLIAMVIERQLNGEVRQSFEAGGLEATLVIPLTHERWPNRVGREEELSGSHGIAGAPSRNTE